MRIIRNVLDHWDCPPVSVKAEDDIHLLFRQLKVKHLAGKEKKKKKKLFLVRFMSS